jgi:hypothetical protein
LGLKWEKKAIFVVAARNDVYILKIGPRTKKSGHPWYMAMENNNKRADWIYLPLSFFVNQLEIFLMKVKFYTRVAVFVLKESVSNMENFTHLWLILIPHTIEDKIIGSGQWGKKFSRLIRRKQLALILNNWSYLEQSRCHCK